MLVYGYILCPVVGKPTLESIFVFVLGIGHEISLSSEFYLSRTRGLLHIWINSVIKFGMDINLTIGCIIASVALVLLTGLVFWSRRIISQIERNGYRSARQTLKELSDDR